MATTPDFSMNEQPTPPQGRRGWRPTFADAAVLGALAVYGMTLAPDAAGLTVLSLDGVTDGGIVHNVGGVNVSAESNYDDSWDAALGYDFTAHPELAYGGQQHDGGWAGGNVADFNTLGKGLVIAGRVPAKILEARKNPGTLYFDFNEPVNKFGLVVVDVDADELTPSSGYFLKFSYQGEVIDTLTYADFITPGSDFYDASIEFGNHTANRIKAIEASDLGDGSFSLFDEVAITPGGSQVIGEVSYAVPTPTAVVGGLSLMALGALRRKRA